MQEFTKKTDILRSIREDMSQMHAEVGEALAAVFTAVMKAAVELPYMNLDTELFTVHHTPKELVVKFRDPGENDDD